MTTKLCKNCTNFHKSYCHHPKNMKRDLVYGGAEVGASGFATCGVLRGEIKCSEVFWCGPDGLGYEQATQEPIEKKEWWRFW